MNLDELFPKVKMYDSLYCKTFRREDRWYLIEDKNTMLRLFISFNGTIGENQINPPDTVYMRLDKYQQYSAPLNEETYNYLEDKEGIIKQLLPFGFSSSIDNLERILEILKPLKETKQKDW